MNPETQSLPDPVPGAPSRGIRTTEGGVRFVDVQEYEIPPEALPNYDKIVIEDGAPVESIFAEKQYSLLTDTLRANWPGPGEGRPFQVFANVGLFVSPTDRVAPDVMLSVDVRPGDPTQREHNSYFIWVFGKPPDVVIELVSDRRGDEDQHKLRFYARAGVPIYAIFDPRERLGQGALRVFGLHEGVYQPREPNWFPPVNLGLTVWEGEYDGMTARWLRWCVRDGLLIPTPAERIALEAQRIQRLEALLRQHGIEPPI
jgi:Uma2 family endonuclease